MHTVDGLLQALVSMAADPDGGSGDAWAEVLRVSRSRVSRVLSVGVDPNSVSGQTIPPSS
jgi:hypothetical protein